jgi:tetratricopeptide (TPR) repeat protein
MPVSSVRRSKVRESGPFGRHRRQEEVADLGIGSDLAAVGSCQTICVGVGPFAGNATPHYRAAQAYKEEQTYLKLEVNSKDINSLVGLGNLYFDYQQFQLAANMYEKALKIDSGNTFVRTDLGVAYFNLGLTDVAVREFNKVLKANPKHVTARYNLGTPGKESRTWKEPKLKMYRTRTRSWLKQRLKT